MLATGSDSDGFALIVDAAATRLLLNGRLVSTTPVTGLAGDCVTRVDAGPAAPRIVAILRASARGRADVLSRVTLLCCIGAVGLTVIFADQTWHSLVTATRWHTDFGPSLAWYQELDRYRYLLGHDQDGTATKRILILLTLALLPVISLLLARRADIGGVGTSAARLAPMVVTAVVITGLALLWLTPSKWPHHFGAMAGLFASFLVVAVVVLLRCARTPNTDRVTRGLGLIGGGGGGGGAGLHGSEYLVAACGVRRAVGGGSGAPNRSPAGFPAVVGRRAGAGLRRATRAPTNPPRRVGGGCRAGGARGGSGRHGSGRTAHLISGRAGTSANGFARGGEPASADRGALLRPGR